MTKKIVSIWVKPEKIQTLDDLSKIGDIKRSRLISNLIKIGYDEISLQKNLGLIHLTLKIDKLKEYYKNLKLGAQSNSPIPDEDTRGTNISVRVDAKLIQKIDRLAKSLQMTRSTFIEYILDISIREVLLLLKVPGFRVTSLFFRDCVESMHNIWKKKFIESAITAESEQDLSD